MIREPARQVYVELCMLDSVELFKLCANDRENSDAWSEFLRRYAVKLRHFIHGTLRQITGASAYRDDSITSSGIQESDLFQNAIVRLVENDCAAMKRFSGTTEKELLAYLAVICRSVVLDALRRDHASKRKPVVTLSETSMRDLVRDRRILDLSESERIILAHELLSLAHSTIESHSGHVSDRDKLVFELHFFEGLSNSQIAQCRGVNLSKTGIEKLLSRLMGRVKARASTDKSEGTLQ